MHIVIILLQDLTIIVNGLRSFSHEIFREVVYQKYIQTPEAHIRWHHQVNGAVSYVCTNHMLTFDCNRCELQ